MKVAKITPELAAQLRGKKPAGCSTLFNPVKDADGNDIICMDMAQHLAPEQYEVIDFKPVVVEEI